MITMTVQDFFKTIDEEEFVNNYLEYDKNFEKARNEQSTMEDRKRIEENGKKMVLSSFRYLKEMKINPNNDIVFGVAVSDNEDNIDSFCVKEEEWKAFKENKEKVPERYGYYLDKEENILGYQISQVSRYMLGDVRYAVSIFYEITFFGFDSENRKTKQEEVHKSLEESMKEIEENGTENCKSMEEVMEEFGWKDERREFEKEFDLNKAKLEGEFFANLIRLIFKQETEYENRNETFSERFSID